MDNITFFSNVTESIEETSGCKAEQENNCEKQKKEDCQGG